MRCPYCNAEDSFITKETRSRDWGIKRRKECLRCNKRFATIEINALSEAAMKSLYNSQSRLYTNNRERELNSENV